MAALEDDDLDFLPPPAWPEDEVAVPEAPAEAPQAPEPVVGDAPAAPEPHVAPRVDEPAAEGFHQALEQAAFVDSEDHDPEENAEAAASEPRYHQRERQPNTQMAEYMQFAIDDDLPDPASVKEALKQRDAALWDGAICT